MKKYSPEEFLKEIICQNDPAELKLMREKYKKIKRKFDKKLKSSKSKKHNLKII